MNPQDAEPDQPAPLPRTLDELRAITDPLERARLITAMVGDNHNLPPAYAALRKEALREARNKQGITTAAIGAAIGVHYTRVSQLTKLPEPLTEGTPS